MLRRVLVVEDDRDIREAEADVLASEGYEVITAEHGKVALERAREVHPELILLDLMMPVMTGWEFRAAQVRDPELAEIPVVVVSAVPPPTGLEPAAHVPKPFEMGELLDAVVKAMPVRSSQSVRSPE